MSPPSERVNEPEQNVITLTSPIVTKDSFFQNEPTEQESEELKASLSGKQLEPTQTVESKPSIYERAKREEAKSSDDDSSSSSNEDAAVEDDGTSSDD